MVSLVPYGLFVDNASGDPLVMTVPLVSPCVALVRVLIKTFVC